MKVQDINTYRGIRYILLDNEYKPIDTVRRYLKFLDNTGKSPNTLKNYAYHLKIYFEYLSIIGVSYDELNTKDGSNAIELFSDFIAWLQYPDYLDKKVVPMIPQDVKRSNKTINIIMNTVLGFYDYLAKNNEIKELELYKIQRSNPKFKSFLYELVGNKKLIKKSLLKKIIDEPNLEYLTRYEYDLIFNLCNNTRDKVIVSLMFEGGLRLGEVLGIHIEDIDIWDNKITIVPRENLENGARVKNQAKEIVFLPDYVMDLLSDYILNELDKYDTDFLLINLNGKNKGIPMKAITVQKLFERFSKNLNRNIHPHMCRHGHATELLEAGWELIDIKERLRHKNINSTSIYAHFADEYKKEQIRKFYKSKDIKFGGENNE